ncbi:MAG: CPBP family intramembrane metalloprotease [Halobacteriales archaeon SW_8_66_22]|nr:MAG: CPBP family intramembrane metalloprotease [Halobacteriales archaeon SW_8_66_22]
MPSRSERAIGLTLSLFGFGLLRPLSQRFEETDIRRHVLKWLPAALVAGYVRLVEGRDAASVGLRWDGPRAFLRRVAVGLAVMLGANVVVQPLLDRLDDGGEFEADIAAFTELGYGERLFAALTAGVTEELLFRGYAFERLEEWSDSDGVAAAVSTVVFVLLHRGETWSWQSVLRISQPAAITTALYARWRDLLALMTVHALNDAVGLLLVEQFEES